MNRLRNDGADRGLSWSHASAAGKFCGRLTNVIVEMNAAMRPIWARSQRTVDTGQLHESLQALLADGLVLIDGGLFFAKLLGRSGARVDDGGDLTGAEAGVNKLHLDDNIVNLNLEGWAEYCVGQGVLLGRAVFKAAAALTAAPVDVLISADLGDPVQVADHILNACPSSTFRFYGRRPNNPWTTDDLEGIVHPVARLRLDPSPV